MAAEIKLDIFYNQLNRAADWAKTSFHTVKTSWQASLQEYGDQYAFDQRQKQQNKPHPSRRSIKDLTQNEGLSPIVKSELSAHVETLKDQDGSHQEKITSHSRCYGGNRNLFN